MKRVLFTKDMTIAEISEAAEKRENELRAVSFYLNEKGKALIEALDLIEWNCVFSETKEELIKNINEDIKRHCNLMDETIVFLNKFIKNTLQ